MAGSVASALEARKLVLLTDTEGVLNEKQLISPSGWRSGPPLIETAPITGGMIPKLKCCTEALRGGVRKAHILDGERSMPCSLRSQRR